MWLSWDSWLEPALAPEAQALIRIAGGVLQLLMLASALPHAARYFRSERWGGYAQSSVTVDAVQNPIVAPVLLAIWVAAAAALVIGWQTVGAAAVNLALCYYFFIRMRWRSVLRGMGAPGFIAFWLAAAIFLLELTARHAPSVRPLALLTLQVDFALIMLSAGIYKLVSGYRAGDGMELGMVNPEWGYWPQFWAARTPSARLFRLFDELAWGTEVVAGAAMLVAPTRFVGGLLMLLSFVFIATQIRLGFLCEMVIVCCLVFFGPATAGGQAIAAVPGLAAQFGPAGAELPVALQTGLRWFLWTYLVLLPIVRVAMYYNQLAHRSLPRALQVVLDTYTNLFGLIIWRVFTADVVNFFVRVWEQSGTGTRRLISHYEGLAWTSRFRQVAECITITSVFTTLKYYPSRRDMFVERLMRYARTIPCAADARLVFEWVNVAKTPDRFIFVPVAEFTVDPAAATVVETQVNDLVSPRAAARRSPIHEGLRPGSYAPAKR